MYYEDFKTVNAFIAVYLHDVYHWNAVGSGGCNE